MNRLETIDLSIRRRRYYSDESSLTNCPECGSSLIEFDCPILLHVKSEKHEHELITNHSGSHFCKKCPVVVFDIDKVERAIKIGSRNNKNQSYFIAGIVDLDSIPEEKRYLEIGSDENPIPLVHFLPDLNTKKFMEDKIPGRNEPCPCGSGKKYKKCCGK